MASNIDPRVLIVSPALAAANTGNWHTAARWARLLRDDCVTAIAAEWRGEPCDVLVALHARRSAESIRRHAEARPDAARIVVLTGTDLYRDIRIDAAARRSLELATRLVVLQPEGLDELDAAARAKCDVVLQSASALRPAVKPARRLRAVAAGHLRDEKDPLTLIAAARRLADRRDIAIELVGRTLDPALGEAALAAMRELPNFRWIGELSRAETRQRIRRAHLLVHPSRIEGGAQVVIEALTSGTPVVASRIPGNTGLLGRDWPALFEPGDAAGLAALLVRARDEPGFLTRLEALARERAPAFAPEAEREALLHSLGRALAAAPSSRRPA